MSFYHVDDYEDTKSSEVNQKLIDKFGCELCPLKGGQDHAYVKPHGSDKPVYYLLDQSPQVSGSTHKVFINKKLRKVFGRQQIPKKFRWNSVVRCSPVKRLATEGELEFCRKSVVEDIEQSKPTIILGLGKLTFQWIHGRKDLIKLWRGRYMPVKIGSHVCWYMPLLHPSDILGGKKRGGFDKLEHVFELDLLRAKKLVGSKAEPNYIREDQLFENIEIVTDYDKLQMYFNIFIKKEYVAIDIENTPLRPYNEGAKIISVGISSGGKTIVFPFKAQFKGPFFHFLKMSRKKIIHNLHHDLEWFLKFCGEDIVYGTEWEDTYSQAYVIDERKIGNPRGNTGKGNLGLNELTLIYYGFELKKYSPINYKNLSSTTLDAFLRGNGLDAKWTYELFMEQRQLINNPQVYRKHVEAAQSLVLTQKRGLFVNTDEVRRHGIEFKKELRNIENQIADRAEVQLFKDTTGYEFNPASDGKDLQHMFLRILELPKVEANNKQGFTFNEAALKTYADEHKSELASLIVKYREFRNLSVKYNLENWGPEGKYIYDDGLVHASFQHALVETGRLSCRNPNLQQLDKRKHKEIRSIIVPPKEHFILAVDFGQIQVRFIALEANDKVLLEYCATGHDFHMEFAQMFASEYPQRIGGKKFRKDKQVMKDFRQDTKSEYVFAKFFGSMDEQCSARLGIPPAIVKKITNKLWTMFPEVRQWHERIKKFYEENGYVESLFGRKRHAPLTPNQIINSSIQADEGEFVNSSMVRLSKLAVELDKPQYQAVIAIHDDLQFYIPKVTFSEDTDFICREMVKIPPELGFISIPMIVEAEMGSVWSEMNSLGEFQTGDFD